MASLADELAGAMDGPDGDFNDFGEGQMGFGRSLADEFGDSFEEEDDTQDRSFSITPLVTPPTQVPTPGTAWDSNLPLPKPPTVSALGSGRIAKSSTSSYHTAFSTAPEDYTIGDTSLGDNRDFLQHELDPKLSHIHEHAGRDLDAGTGVFEDGVPAPRGEIWGTTQITKDPMVELEEYLDLSRRLGERIKTLLQLGPNGKDDAVEEGLSRHLQGMKESTEKRDEQLRMLGSLVLGEWIPPDHKDEGYGDDSFRLDNQIEKLISPTGVEVLPRQGQDVKGLGLENEESDLSEEELGWIGGAEVKSSLEPNHEDQATSNRGNRPLSIIEETDPNQSLDQISPVLFDTWLILDPDISTYTAHTHDDHNLSPITPTTAGIGNFPLLPRLVQEIEYKSIRPDHLSTFAEELHISLSHYTSIARKIRGIQAASDNLVEREELESEAREAIEVWETQRMERGIMGGPSLKDRLDLEMKEFGERVDHWGSSMDAVRQRTNELLAR